LTIDQGDKGNDNVAVGTDRSHLMLRFRQLLLPYDSVLGYGLEAGTASWFYRHCAEEVIAMSDGAVKECRYPELCRACGCATPVTPTEIQEREPSLSGRDKATCAIETLTC
jgi:hypothetical protein